MVGKGAVMVAPRKNENTYSSLVFTKSCIYEAHISQDLARVCDSLQSKRACQLACAGE
jgi:hypothetical protein